MSEEYLPLDAFEEGNCLTCKDRDNPDSKYCKTCVNNFGYSSQVNNYRANKDLISSQRYNTH